MYTGGMANTVIKTFYVYIAKYIGLYKLYKIVTRNSNKTTQGLRCVKT